MLSHINRVTSVSCHNLHHSEERIPLRSDSDKSPEFDFGLRQNSKHKLSHADELFSDWKSLSLTSTTTTSKKSTETTSPRSNSNVASKSDTRDSDSDDSSFGCGFWLVRSKSVGFLMRNKKSDASLEYHRSNSDPQNKNKNKKKKSLQKMNSTEIRASMKSPALNVPLADLFCLGRRK